MASSKRGAEVRPDLAERFKMVGTNRLRADPDPPDIWKSSSKQAFCAGYEVVAYVKPDSLIWGDECTCKEFKHVR